MKNLMSKGLKWGVCVLALVAAIQVQAGDDTYKIAKDRSIPGKFGHETCDQFARELYSRLTKAGGEAHYIVYEWSSPTKGQGLHAFVVYRDANGRYFGMDQKTRQPVWLTGFNAKSWASWFSGTGDVRVVRAVTDPALEGQYADLSRTAPVIPQKASSQKMVAKADRKPTRMVASN